MLPAGTIRRWRVLVVGVAVLAGAALVTACEPQTDAQPPVASVDFEPRLVVTVDDSSINAEVGSRDGAQAVHGPETADWTAPAGSVVELRNDSTDPRRILITRSTSANTDIDPAGTAPTVWLDTGDIQPGESVVLGLSAPGEYAFAETTTGVPGTPELTVLVAPRPTA